jgi:hypothetical protein
MSIRTSDGVVVDNFEKLQAIVKKIQDTQVMKKVSGREKEGEASYNGHRIRVDNYTALTTHIPNLLNDMALCHWKGEVYSGGKDIFLKCFAKHLHFLLAWFGSIETAGTVSSSASSSNAVAFDPGSGVALVDVTASVMEKAISRMQSIMEDVGVCTKEELMYVKCMVKQFSLGK